jgi:peptidoglycan biosynthesis protein MviN/MurJ (putative lipid II flippase)
MDVAGISLATTLVSALSFLLSAMMLSEHTDLKLRQLVKPLAAMFGCAVVAYVATAGTYYLIAPPPASGKIVQAVLVAISSVFGLIVYALGCWLLRVPELEFLLRPVLKRVFKSK